MSIKFISFLNELFDNFILYPKKTKRPYVKRKELYWCNVALSKKMIIWEIRNC